MTSSRAEREARGVGHAKAPDRLVVKSRGEGAVDGLLDLQRSVGNRTVAPLLAAAQRKTVVGAAGDRYEQTAEAVARRVLESLRSRPAAEELDHSPSVGPDLRRRPVVGAVGGDLDADSKSVLESRIGRGRPLDSDLRRTMEGAFAADFSNVRIHEDEPSAQLNRQVQASAFTHGKDIFFGSRVDFAQTSGQGLLAHELTHVVQQGAAAPQGRIGRHQIERPVIRRARTALSTKEVLSTLNAVPFLRGKLDDTIQGRTVRARVEAEMRAYKTHFAKKTDEDMNIRDAMMLSMALEGIARAIAEDLNDASVQPVIMTKLFELYRTDVEAKLRKKKSSLKRSQVSMPKILNLTGALLEGDPVTQFMHREIHLDVAAAQIVAMAAKMVVDDPTITPERLFELLEQRFQAKMASYSQSELHVNDSTKSYGMDETHGEYSQYFFTKMFGAEAFSGPGGGAGWESGGKKQPDRLKFTADSEQRLAALLAKVKAPPVVAGAGVTRDPKVTAGQEQHLASIELAEAGNDESAMKARFASFFATRYGLTGADAARLYVDVAAYLRGAIPFTITAKAADWFKPGQATNPDFKPATAAKATTPVKDVFGKPQALGDIEHLPTWKDKVPTAAEARGPKYLRFRHWKDQLLTGLRELQSQEMAVFGAANSTWEGARGSDTPTQHGTNYYGDFHFVLKRANVKDRTVYTATDHGAPHRDPVLVLNDFTFGDRGLTWLKDVKRLTMLDAVVNAVRLKTALYGMPLLFEVQIFGGINIKTDVAEVHLSSAVDAPTERRIKRFYKGTGVAVSKIDATAPAGRVFAPGGLTDLDGLIMAAAGHGSDVERQEFERDTAGIADQMTRVPVRAAYGLALYIKHAATQGLGGLTPADIAVLDDSAVKMNAFSGAGAGLPALVAKNLRDRIKEATDALAAAKNPAVRPPRLSVSGSGSGSGSEESESDDALLVSL